MQEKTFRCLMCHVKSIDRHTQSPEKELLDISAVGSHTHCCVRHIVLYTKYIFYI